MQIYVPLNTKISYDETKPFANALARLLENEHRDLVVSDMKKAVRTNKVFVDWSQNDEHKTTISVYSLRAREQPTVSTPITWEEVERALKKKDAKLLVFQAHQTLDRVQKMGDFFAPLLKLKQELPKVAAIGEVEEDAPVDKVQIAAQADQKRVPKSAPKKKSAAGRSSTKARQRI